MVKMEAFEDSHFMPQAVRVGLTDHTGSIVSSMECIFDLKNKFLYCHSLGVAKIEAFDDSYFMHQTVIVCHTDHTYSFITGIA